jgi:hypothetical protein
MRSQNEDRERSSALILSRASYTHYWSLEWYLDMHDHLIQALAASEQELLRCEYLCGHHLRDMAQDVFIMCVAIRACVRLTGQYTLRKDLLTRLLALMRADNSYMPFGYTAVQKECIYLLAHIDQNVLMGIDPLDIATAMKIAVDVDSDAHVLP